MKKYKICIISHAHLTNNPRVYKEAITLSKSGYDVSIVTVLINKALYQSDLQLLKEYNIDYSHSINLITGVANQLKIFTAKLKRKAAQLLSRFTGIELPQSLSYAIEDLFKSAENQNADLYIGHNEPGLWVGVELIKKGRNVAFDFEDWYSQDYLVPGRAVKLLSQLEKYALQNAKYVTTTSQSLADALALEYATITPTVLYNAFSIAEKQIPTVNEELNLPFKLYWFSQSIGPGRGIEQIMDAINLANQPIELNLRGNVTSEFREILTSKLLNKKHSLNFLPLVHPAELTKTMKFFHAGLSLEQNHPKSRDLTVTNKILHYLLGGLPVLASYTKGQQEICELSEGAVIMIDLKSPQQTAQVIEDLLTNTGKLKWMQEKALKVSAEKFNWEIQEQVLLSNVRKAIQEN